MVQMHSYGWNKLRVPPCDADMGSVGHWPGASRPYARGAALCALLVTQVLSQSASAGTNPQSATVTIATTVLDDCSVVGAVGPSGWRLNFGTYQLGASAAANFSTVLYCTKGTIVSSVTLNNGLHYLAATRNMYDAASHALPYKIYTGDCASRTTEWIGANSPSAFASTTSTSVRTAMGGSACGTIDVGSNAPAGTYSDTVTLTVNFT